MLKFACDRSIPLGQSGQAALTFCTSAPRRVFCWVSLRLPKPAWQTSVLYTSGQNWLKNSGFHKQDGIRTTLGHLSQPGFLKCLENTRPELAFTSKDILH